MGSHSYLTSDSKTNGELCPHHSLEIGASCSYDCQEALDGMSAAHHFVSLLAFMSGFLTPLQVSQDYQHRFKKRLAMASVHTCSILGEEGLTSRDGTQAMDTRQSPHPL